ncbi:peptidylprolyl isomerase [uncultured Roseovarius sp.]|uniref:peptidylprolyl isomerase n=1 Tax=uncultured Roseovarius sp. TaxID=293344 RepID=UPI003390236A
MRKFLAAITLPALMAAVLAWSAHGPAHAQNLFAPAIRVNDQVITGFELQQRARMLTLFRAPGNPQQLAREQLIEDRLKLDAAETAGLVLEDADVQVGMEEFASRAGMTAEQFLRALDGAGVAEQTYRDFVKAGIAWRELISARFAPRVSVNETDVDRARIALGGGSGGVRVLLSELIMPAPAGQEQAVQERAARIAELSTIPAFAAEARRYSAAPSAARGGRLDWMPITNMPPQLRPIILGLGPGEVSEPLPIPGAVALFQLRDIEETDAPDPEYSAIEYAAYYISGGHSQKALARAQQVKDNTDVCDDLYGIAKGEPPEVLERGSRAPEEIPQDIAIELAKLDPGEVSTTLTRSNGQTLVFLMLCGRTPKLEGEGPSNEQLGMMIRNQRLDSFANGYLEQLRAEARIVDLE